MTSPREPLYPGSQVTDLGVAGPSRGERGLRSLALAVAVTFVVVGLLGFIPGVTTNVDQLRLAGHHSDARLVGLFQVSVLHNVLHLLLGLAGVVMSRLRPAVLSIWYLVGGGVLYLGLWVYGLVVDHDSGANVVPLNEPDNWLHLGLGVGMIVLGVVGQRAWRGPIGTQTPM